MRQGVRPLSAHTGDGRKTHDAVKLGALVALRPPGRVLGLTGAELAEVVGRLGDEVAEELKGDAAQRFACEGSCGQPAHGIEATRRTAERHVEEDAAGPGSARVTCAAASFGGAGLGSEKTW